MLHPWLWGLGLGLTLVSSGCVVEAFACSRNDQCVVGSNEGVCQPSGWCSFEDPDCESMQRFGEYANGEVAGSCVPVVEEMSSGPVSPPDPPVGTTTGVDGGNTLDGTSGAESTGPTIPPPPPPITGPSDSSSSDDGSVEESSGAVEPLCATVLYDDFEDGRFGLEWGHWQDLGAEVEELDSVIRFSITQGGPGGTDAGLNSEDTFDLTEGYVRIEVAEPPNGDFFRLYWQMMTPDCTVGAFIQNGEIVVDDVSYAYGEGTTWLQLRTEAGMIHVERSTDGVLWELVLPPSPVECDLRDAGVFLFGGIGDASDFPATTAVSSIEVCGS